MIAETTGVERLAAVLGTRLDRSPLAVMLDIDGTLAPIAPRPEAAAIPTATRAVLEQLVALPDTFVALVTGRSVSDATRLSVTGVWIIGNHGLEIRSPDGTLAALPEAARFEQLVATAVQSLMPLEREIEGVLIENKRWGLSVHYRLTHARDLARVMQRVEEISRATGLRVTGGKKILELRPPVDIDKGTATLAFLDRAGVGDATASAIYVGDDRTDEDAFRALRSKWPRAVTARVVASDEEPVETSAELVLSSLTEVRELLVWIVKRRSRLAR